jgi:LEA14-like dessication related protein
MIIETTKSMKHLRIITLLCFGWAVFSFTSCNFTLEQKEQMIKSRNGKDYFRDSEKWGKVVTKTLELEPFAHIVMDGNADIDLRQGEDFSVEVTGNEKAIEANDIKVEKAEKEGDNTLHVVAKDAPRNLPSIKLKIIVPNLRSVKVNGDGDLEIKGDDFFTGNLDIEINGDGDFEAPHVDCAKLNIIINGDGDVVAKKFNCEDVTIQMDGNGDITTDLKANNINLQLTSDGEANLDVKCDNLIVSAGGSGDVKLKGKCHNLTKQSFGKASLDSRRLQVTGNIKIQ